VKQNLDFLVGTVNPLRPARAKILAQGFFPTL